MKQSNGPVPPSLYSGSCPSPGGNLMSKCLTIVETSSRISIIANAFPAQAYVPLENALSASLWMTSSGCVDHLSGMNSSGRGKLRGSRRKRCQRLSSQIRLIPYLVESYTSAQTLSSLEVYKPPPFEALPALSHAAIRSKQLDTGADSR